MVKKQALVVLILLMSFTGSSFGLGLGDINVSSNLNDPLEAEIKVLQLQGLTSGEILPTLASNDDFRRAGVERNFFLSNIEFRVKEMPSGEVFIALSTNQVVREPFLNFLVEVNWPGGRLLKEYTILLDPPVFDTGLSADALVVESTTPAVTEIVTTTTIANSVVDDVVETAPTPEPRDDTLPDGEYRVERNDTLWEIALKVPGGSGYSPQQVMLAIQDLNASAFLNNNINRVKAGSVLTLPTEAQIALRSLQEAIEEVDAQNKGAAPKLRSSETTETSEAQLSATDTTGSALESANDAKNPDGYLELSADSDDGLSGAGETSEEVEQLLGQLAVAEELNDQYVRERDDLESKVNELQEQIDIMTRLLDLQNADIAEVQQAIEQTSQAQETIEEEAVTEAPLEQEQFEAPVVAEPVSEEPIQATPPAPVKQDFMWYVNEYARVFSDWVMKSTTNMAIAGASLLLLVLIPLYIRSKQSDGDDLLDDDEEIAGIGSDDEEYDSLEDDDLLAEMDGDFEDDDSESEQIDAVMEAEMYMAYQKYDQAEEKLKEAIADYPGRADIGLKLLEVYAEMGNTESFNNTENSLDLDDEQQQQANALRAKLPLDQPEPDSDNLMMAADNVYDLDIGTDAEPEIDTDFDFSLDENDIAAEPLELPEEAPFDLDLVEETEEAEATSDPDDLSDLDFSLDLGDLDVDLEGDSGLSLDSDDELEIDEPEAEPAADFDFTLDIDDDEDELLEPASAELSSVLDDDIPLADEIAEIDLGDLELSADDDELDFTIDDEDDESFDIDLSENAELESADEESDPVQTLTDSLDSEADLDEDEFDFLAGSDEISTKLDLARAYIEMEDKEGARDILDEVMQEGNDEQKAQADGLIKQL